VMLDNASSPLLTVDAVDQQAGTVVLLNDTGTYIDISVGTRLVRMENSGGPDLALLYPDPMGSGVGVSSVEVPPDGWVVGYVADYRFDFILSGTGVTTRIFPDAEGSFVLR